MKTSYDIEKNNRNNFRSSLEALARPGEEQAVLPMFGSGLLAMASVLLYAEVSYFYRGALDFNMIRAICGPKEACRKEADYLFFDTPEPDYLAEAKIGTAENPEQGATLLFSCPDSWASTTKVRLSGPGIDGSRDLLLPLSAQFLDRFTEKNDSFPMGIDLFLLNGNNRLLGLPRTTRIEVIR